MRVVTAGESHGPQLTIIVENLPAGMPLLAEDVDVDLARRQRGYGRGGRQQIEHDCVEFVAGVRHGRTMGGPIAMVVKNRDWANWQGKMDIAPVPEPPPPVTRLRPGHADLAGVVKFGLDDVRDVLERASARETASRVAAGGLAKAFLRQFDIQVRSHVRSIGAERAEVPEELAVARDGASHAWWTAVDESTIRTGDAAFEEAAIEMIKSARTAGDTLGGVFEVIAYGVPIGLGTYGQWDERLDGRLAAAIMSIQSLKGVEIGDAFANAGRFGSQAHDVIDYDATSGWSRPTNHAGGLEGGVSNGMPLIVRGAAKPISTLINPLPSVNYATRERDVGHVERSDVCVLPAAGVVGEAMVAIVVADAMRVKFGGDSLDEALSNFRSYLANSG
ncbi:MAG: chorismate synthase [Chloroflexi bacterium]|nr:chorismate synthase [Chloroflexota bacterium]